MRADGDPYCLSGGSASMPKASIKKAIFAAEQKSLGLLPTEFDTANRRAKSRKNGIAGHQMAARQQTPLGLSP
jgi:hypothetical protein